MSGARRRGRPRTAWMDNIKTWTGISVEESVRMTGINGEKVRPWCGQPSARGRLKNRTEQNSGIRRRAIAGRPPSPSRLHPNFLRFNAVRAVLLCDVSHARLIWRGDEGRNHVFKVRKSNFWVWGITALLHKKLRKVYRVWRSLLPHQTPTQNYVKVGGVSQIQFQFN